MPSPAEGKIAVVIDDDPDVRSLVATVLEQAGFVVHARADGALGLDAVVAYDPVVTTVDVDMPGMDGVETARRIRAVSSTYIVMLTALSSEVDTLAGLEAGADDYITKPFRPRELRARIDAMLRRPRDRDDVPSPRQDEERSHRGLAMNRRTRDVTINGSAVALTRSEFELLFALMVSGRTVVSKADLAAALHGDGYVANSALSAADERSVEVHLANIRKKIGESSTDPRWFETVRGVGYRLTRADGGKPVDGAR